MKSKEKRRKKRERELKKIEMKKNSIQEFKPKLKETKKFAPLFFFYADFLWTTVGPNSSYSALLTCCCCWNTTRARIAPPAQAAEAAIDAGT